LIIGAWRERPGAVTSFAIRVCNCWLLYRIFANFRQIEQLVRFSIIRPDAALSGSRACNTATAAVCSAEFNLLLLVVHRPVNNR
jgi:hypothetical protein